MTYPSPSPIPSPTPTPAAVQYNTLDTITYSLNTLPHPYPHPKPLTIHPLPNPSLTHSLTQTIRMLEFPPLTSPFTRNVKINPNPLTTNNHDLITGRSSFGKRNKPNGEQTPSVIPIPSHFIPSQGEVPPLPLPPLGRGVNFSTYMYRYIDIDI